MKISTNSVGNYSPIKFRETQVAKQVDKAPEQNKTQEISNKEKQFFASMYPEKKSEIMDYYFYQKSGKMSGVQLGSLVDKRG